MKERKFHQHPLFPFFSLDFSDRNFVRKEIGFIIIQEFMTEEDTILV